MAKTAWINCRLFHEKLDEWLISTILVNEKGRIIDVLSENSGDLSGYTIKDARQAYVIPGLINAHAHLFASGAPSTKKYPIPLINSAYRLLNTSLGLAILRKIMKKHALIELQSGVTTIRSVGEFFYQDVRLRDRFTEEANSWPDLLTSGFFLSTTGGHGAPYLALETDSPWEGRKNVRKNVRQGVDWIKICVTGGVTDARRIGEAGALQLTEPEIAAICDEAHKNKMMVAAHVQSTEGVRIALKAGVDTIEHGAPMDDEIIALFKNNPQALRGYSALMPTFQAAAPFAVIDKETLGLNPVTVENGRLVYEGMLEGLQQAIAHHITWGVGNDASMTFVPHYDFWRELAITAAAAGLAPKEMIQRATAGNAAILGIDHEVGTIAPDKKANFILLEKNPHEDLRALTKLQAVVKEGQLVKGKPIKRFTELDQLMDQVLQRIKETAVQ